ncbi:energy transducer TonB [Hymenobacter radiodurans]|uniref:energy transducer TonB n=1 Tax=Hymenobacter radiodurans TaxID=2496028 RepID=UPI00105902D0|nr:energy transducer TonB [Hymenobacter radiodurans]
MGSSLGGFFIFFLVAYQTNLQARAAQYSMLNLPILNVRIQPCLVAEQHHLTPQALGHHCALCDRLVQDFTNSSQADLEQARVDSLDGRVCGRFSPAQLMPTVRLRPKLRQFLVALVLVCGLGLTRQEVMAQIQDSTQRHYPIDTKVYGMVAQQMPVYKNGGNAAIITAIMQNLRYPAGHTIVGRVIVKFTIDKAGLLQEPTIIKGLGSPFDQEALRAVSLLGPWNPGKQNGQPVEVPFTIPVNFRPPGKPTP